MGRYNRACPLGFSDTSADTDHLTDLFHSIRPGMCTSGDMGPEYGTAPEPYRCRLLPAPIPVGQDR